MAIFMHGEPGAIVYEVHSVSWEVVAKQLFTSATPTPAGYIRYKCANRLRGGDGNSACFAG